MNPRLVALVSLCMASGAPTPSLAVAYTDLYVFGNSLVDSGNLFISTGSLFPPAPYRDGRFTNGPTFVEVLAGLLGLGPLQPSLAGGSNYAWGGARAGTDIPAGPFTIPSVRTQVDGFFADLGGDSPDPDALYVLSGGGNDIINARQNTESGADQMAAAAAALIGAAEALTARGAVHVVVLAVPAESSPRYLGDAEVTALSAAFNAALDAGLPLGVIRYDPRGALFSAAATEITVDTACLTDDDLCDDPDAYFFFDDIHPTAAGHALVAEGLLQVLKSATAVARTSWGQIKGAVSMVDASALAP